MATDIDIQRAPEHDAEAFALWFCNNTDIPEGVHPFDTMENGLYVWQETRDSLAQWLELQNDPAPQIAKGKTEFFDKLKDHLRKNGGGIVNDRGRVESIARETDTNYDWRKDWGRKAKLERPNDRLPRGIKAASITEPYGLMWDEFPSTAH